MSKLNTFETLITPPTVIPFTKYAKPTPNIIPKAPLKSKSGFDSPLSK